MLPLKAPAEVECPSGIGDKARTIMRANVFWLHLKRRISVGRNVQIGKNFHVGLLTNVSTAKRLTIGNDVYIGKFCAITGSGAIGDGVLIGNRVGVGIEHPCALRDTWRTVKGAAFIEEAEGQIDIGCDVWIGFGSILLSGVSIGRGAVVGAGSVVMDNVAPYDIVGGNPAKRVGRRFSDDQIRCHEARVARREPHQRRLTEAIFQA
jgi:acetyltransferase-like isoleucine patch superfamily enzyme